MEKDGESTARQELIKLARDIIEKAHREGASSKELYRDLIIRLERMRMESL